MQESARIHLATATEIEFARTRILDDLGNHIQELKRMANRWALYGIPSQKTWRNAWEQDANNYVKDTGVFQAVELDGVLLGPMGCWLGADYV